MCTIYIYIGVKDFHINKRSKGECVKHTIVNCGAKASKPEDARQTKTRGSPCRKMRAMRNKQTHGKGGNGLLSMQEINNYSWHDAWHEQTGARQENELIIEWKMNWLEKGSHKINHMSNHGEGTQLGASKQAHDKGIYQAQRCAMHNKYERKATNYCAKTLWKGRKRQYINRHIPCRCIKQQKPDRKQITGARSNGGTHTAI